MDYFNTSSKGNSNCYDKNGTIHEASTEVMNTSNSKQPTLTIMKGALVKPAIFTNLQKGQLQTKLTGQGAWREMKVLVKEVDYQEQWILAEFEVLISVFDKVFSVHQATWCDED